jgi:hypothetical protein
MIRVRHHPRRPHLRKGRAVRKSQVRDHSRNNRARKAKFRKTLFPTHALDRKKREKEARELLADDYSATAGDYDDEVKQQKKTEWLQQKGLVYINPEGVPKAESLERIKHDKDLNRYPKMTSANRAIIRRLDAAERANNLAEDIHLYAYEDYVAGQKQQLDRDVARYQEQEDAAKIKQDVWHLRRNHILEPSTGKWLTKDQLIAKGGLDIPKNQAIQLDADVKRYAELESKAAFEDDDGYKMP